MAEVISIITSTPWLMELLKVVMPVLAVLIVSLIKIIATKIYKKRNNGVAFDKKKLEYVFFVGSFVIAFALVLAYTYVVDFKDWESTLENAGGYAMLTPFFYKLIQAPRKTWEACKNSVKLHKFFCLIGKIFTKKATPADVKDAAKELTAIEKFMNDTEI